MRIRSKLEPFGRPTYHTQAINVAQGCRHTVEGRHKSWRQGWLVLKTRPSRELSVNPLVKSV